MSAGLTSVIAQYLSWAAPMIPPTPELPQDAPAEALADGVMEAARALVKRLARARNSQNKNCSAEKVVAVSTGWKPAADEGVGDEVNLGTISTLSII